MLLWKNDQASLFTEIESWMLYVVCIQNVFDITLAQSHFLINFSSFAPFPAHTYTCFFLYSVISLYLWGPVSNEVEQKLEV